MRPYVRPDAEEAEFMPSRRAAFPRQSRINQGTLNLFSPSYYQAVGPSQPTGLGPRTSAPGSRSGSRGRYHNYESTETREFPSSGLRRVQPLKHTDAPQGIRHLGTVPAAQQNIQVVNITAAYKDPMQMTTARPTVRVLPEKLHSTDVRDSLAYVGTPYPTQLRGELREAPVGKARSGAPKRIVDYTRQENFCQTVRDHVQQRAKGVTEFYVQLCRGTIGGVGQRTPAPTPRLWSLEQGPEARTLTLASCRDQLASFTDMPVTLLELADLIWDMSEYKTRVSTDASRSGDDAQTAADLGGLVVPYKDFSAAFGANSNNVRLAIKKL